MKRFNDNIFKKFNKTRVEKLESKKMSDDVGFAEACRGLSNNYYSFACQR